MPMHRPHSQWIPQYWLLVSPTTDRPRIPCFDKQLYQLLCNTSWRTDYRRETTEGGSCNPAPMGIVPTSDNMPSIRIASPSNNAVLAANADITLLLRSRNFRDGFVVNSNANFLAAPQQLHASGTVIGHYHIVIERLDALNSTAVNDCSDLCLFQDRHRRQC
ncbi:hypothetical protein C8J57DRAFT_665451 [Mycena rebaudengoi]|nr:hypothetical protein C8J57DRAFT_665451 [Mycena rebaudengoi]